MTKTQYADYQAAIERNLKGLSFISTGACPGCQECGLEHKECKRCAMTEASCPDCHGTGRLPCSNEAIEVATEGSFSDLFPPNVGAWAESVSDELSMLSFELDSNPQLITP